MQTKPALIALFIQPLLSVPFILAATIFAAANTLATPSREWQQGNGKIVAQIRSVLQAQQEAWNRGDLDAFMNAYARSASTVFVSEDKVTRGWKALRDRYKKRYSDRAKMGTLTFSALEITPLSDDCAVALGHWELKGAIDQPHGRFTLIFRRLDAGWQIVHDHTSAASPPR